MDRNASNEPPTDRRRRRNRHAKAFLMGLLLLNVAVLGPSVAFAGVTIIWPKSGHTVDINTEPPLKVNEGADMELATSLNFSADFTVTNHGASFSVTLKGLSGGALIVDRYFNVSASANVTSYKIQVADALDGTLSTPTELKVRLWTGTEAPTSDGDPQVCAVLDLKAGAGTESATACTADADAQLVYELPDAATGSSTVSLRFSSIVFA